ncbi:MAG: carbohydrate kinase [Litoreibacter sp.]|nr:carbohydrate kinase [Litoreibacter sp.]
MSKDLIIGIDAGTSVMKSVAFDLSGRQIDVVAHPNGYDIGPGGSVTQPIQRTWEDCAATLRDLGQKIPNLAQRVAAVAVTGQGDGTWLIDHENRPVGDAWLWLDGRAGALAESFRQDDGDHARFEITGTGLNACQMGVQLAYMREHMPEVLDQADCAFHCKDWLYLNLTNARVTDPSEATFTYGDYRTLNRSDEVIGFLGLSDHADLLPQTCDGVQTTHALTPEAAVQTGLLAGTPVSLGYVDIICTVLGGGGYLPKEDTGCTIVGTTGVHVQCKDIADVVLNPERTGYVMTMPIPGKVAQLQTNMAGTLNIDWVLGLARDLCNSLGFFTTDQALLAQVENWMAQSTPGSVVYHPYISEAGERGPFIDHTARASLIGLTTEHGYVDLIRAAIEGLSMASRDCYLAMGALPDTVTLTGGAARSVALRETYAAALGASVRLCSRVEAGAAGAAMIAAVANEHHANMDACASQWVIPLLSPLEPPRVDLVETYEKMFDAYRTTRDALRPTWGSFSSFKGTP